MSFVKLAENTEPNSNKELIPKTTNEQTAKHKHYFSSCLKQNLVVLTIFISSQQAIAYATNIKSNIIKTSFLGLGEFLELG